MLKDLMDACKSHAKTHQLDFTPFNLQDCRPSGLTEKLEQGHQDAVDAMGHTSDRMVRKVYDLRPIKKATPVK